MDTLEAGHKLGENDLANDMTERTRAEELSRLVVESAPSAIVLVDQSGRITLVNTEAESLFGYERRELVGSTLDGLVPERFRLSHATQVDRFFSNPHARRMESSLALFARRKDGTEIPVEIGLTPLRTPGGPLVMATIVDISDRKKAEHLQQALYDIAQAPDTIESLGDLYPRIHEIISGVMPAPNFFISLYDAERDRLVFPYFVDQADRVEVAGISPERGLTAYVLRTGRSLLCTQAVHDELERRGEIKLLGSPSAIWLGVPLVVNTKIIGAMVVQHYTDPDAYSERDQQILEYVSSQVAHAIERKRVEEELRLNEQRLRQIIDLVPHFIFAKDLEGRFILVNQAVADVYGTTVTDLTGKMDADFATSEGEVEHFRADDMEVIRTGLPKHIPEEPITDANGNLRILTTTKIPFSFSGSSAQAVLGVSMDITDRIRAERGLDRQREEAAALAEVGRTISESLQLEAVLERIADHAKDMLNAETSAVYLVEPATSSLRAVAAKGPDAEEIKEYPLALGVGILGRIALQQAGEIINDTFDDPRAVNISGTEVVPDEHLMGVPVLSRGELIGLIAVWRIGAGQEFQPSEMEFLARLAGQVAVAIVNARLFEEIQHLNSNLEKRVAQRTAELSRAKDEAEAASKELEAFSYSVSHDLRTPLRGISGFAGLLMREYGQELPPEARRYIAQILDGSRRMGQLIEDLLKLSRVTRQPLRHERVDLSALAHEIVDGLSSVSAERGVEFVIEDGVVVTGDPGLLHIVMENLIDNSWKYTSRREQARIEFGASRSSAVGGEVAGDAPGAPEAIYFVQDNGAGFEMAYAATLFGTFQRLHSETEFEGTGIGLATVQRIIHRHGGRVWAKGEVDKGATFYFTLADGAAPVQLLE